MTHLSVLALVLFAGMQAAGGTQKMSPPGADPSGPKWQRVLKLSDGRTFVTDGGLAIDAALAKPAVLPTVTVGSPTVLETYMAAQLPTEVGLLQLTRSSGSRGYSGPNGLTLNAVYVDYLRRTLPAGRVTLRIGKNTEPIPIVLDGKPVGVLMALRSSNPRR